jgi:hypothetical protein
VPLPAKELGDTLTLVVPFVIDERGVTTSVCSTTWNAITLLALVAPGPDATRARVRNGYKTMGSHLFPKFAFPVRFLAMV